MPPNALLLSVQTSHRRTRSSSQDGAEAGCGRAASPRLMTLPLCTPPLQMGGQAGFNPHSRLLRRSSSCSTLSSIADSDDGRAGVDPAPAMEAQVEAEWTRTDIERLRSVGSFACYLALVVANILRTRVRLSRSTTSVSRKPAPSTPLSPACRLLSYSRTSHTRAGASTARNGSTRSRIQGQRRSAWLGKTKTKRRRRRSRRGKLLAHSTSPATWTCWLPRDRSCLI